MVVLPSIHPSAFPPFGTKEVFGHPMSTLTTSSPTQGKKNLLKREAAAAA
jgi:hypothetical protein